MKNTILAVAIAAVLATGVSFVAGHWIVSRHHLHAAHSTHDVAWLTRELDLTTTQARGVEACERDFRTEMETFCSAHCGARFALGEELAKPKPDLEKARAQVEKMNALQADVEHATLDHIARVRALLTPEQGEEYGSMLHHEICSACPLGLHRHGNGSAG